MRALQGYYASTSAGLFITPSLCVRTGGCGYQQGARGILFERAESQFDQVSPVPTTYMGHVKVGRLLDVINEFSELYQAA